jgi:beta-xylosidase
VGHNWRVAAETCQDPSSVPERRHSGRVEALIARATLDQKLAQLVGLWAGASRTDGVAPMQDRLLADEQHFETFAADGLGQLTRHYGTTPLESGMARGLLAERQEWLRTSTPLGIPAVVHEECLTGVLAWGATCYPTPLAWGATFDPALIGEMANRIGEDMRALGIHQGLGPVLDVVRDLRWGRVEECIAEDPHLVGAIGSAYVAGLESTGRVATLKHFLGYSNSRAGRNVAPVGAGPRELAEVFLPPFERAIREGGARSVMNSYTEIDGVPVAADPDLLTGLLRDDVGFTGTVVSDYFTVPFLVENHRVAGSLGEAAALTLAAGIDVELPTGSGYLAPLRELVMDGAVSELLVDRALGRVLAQKEQLGLLDDDWVPDRTSPIDLDSAANCDVARRVAEESIVLLSNDGLLPLGGAALDGIRRVAVIGPNALSPESMLGCYSFVNHVLTRHPDVDRGIEVQTVAEAVMAEFGGVGTGAELAFDVVAGCAHTGDDRSGFDEARAAAAGADLAIVVVGDRSGMFGLGTSGEGCDVVDLELPGVQRELVELVLDTGVPTILVLVTGRAYVLDGLVDRARATVQAFLPGQEGATAIAGVLSGRVAPSGRLPIGIPTGLGTQPSTYLHPRLGEANTMSAADPTPAFPFGFGLGYTEFETTNLVPDVAEVATDGTVTLSVRVTNVGERAGAEVVQLYLRGRVAEVTRPVVELVAFDKVTLEAGASTTVHFTLPSRTLSFIGRGMERVVAPGELEFFVGSDCRTALVETRVTLTGERRVVPKSEFTVASAWHTAD